MPGSTATEPGERPEPVAPHPAERTATGILVGVDGSAPSRHALRWALHRADRFGSVRPLIAWRYPWWAYSMPIPPPSEEFKKRAQDEMALALEGIPSAEAPQPLDSIVARANAGPVLVEVGATARLIVVGTRGRSGLEDGLLGSVSSYVAAHATVPVAIVPPHAPIEDTHGRVVVGVDGSVNSMGALRWAVRHAPPDAIIEAIHTWIYPAGAMPGLATIPYQVYEDKAQWVLNDAVRAVVKAAGTHQHRIVPRLEYGDARSVLKELALDCDLLVLGARGRGGVSHLLLGSVTTALVHQPTAPTVVVPMTEH